VHSLNASSDSLPDRTERQIDRIAGGGNSFPDSPYVVDGECADEFGVPAPTQQVYCARQGPAHRHLPMVVMGPLADIARRIRPALLMRGEIAEQPPEIIVSSRESGLRPPLLARMR
jgi:hypothetical protein